MENNLKRLRMAAGLSQLRLSLETGLSLSSIAAWESGQRELTNIHKIRRLCRALDCRLEELVPDVRN